MCVRAFACPRRGMPPSPRSAALTSPSLDLNEVRRYLTRVKTRVSSKGQIVLPADLRRQDGVEAGQEFNVERLDRGEYRLVRRAVGTNEGLVDWLLACPQKGFFVPVESESTDGL